MPGPIDALKAASPDAQAQQLMKRNQMMSGQMPQEPMMPMPTNVKSPTGNMFQLQHRGPDIEGLIRAMEQSGFTGSRTGDIELDPAAQPAMDFEEIMRRSKAITGM